MDSINYKRSTYSLQSQNSSKPTLTEHSQIEIDKVVQLYRALLVDSSTKSSHFIELILAIQRNVNARQSKEEVIRSAIEQLNELFSNSNNAFEAKELALILLNLVAPCDFMISDPEDSLLTLEVQKLLEEVTKLAEEVEEAKEVERRQKDSQSIFNLSVKDIDSQIVGYLDNRSRRAMRLVSKVACERVSEKLKLELIDFKKIDKGETVLADLCKYYEGLNFPSVSIAIKVDKWDLNQFTRVIESLSKNTKIKEMELFIGSSHLGDSDSAALTVSTVFNITMLDISGQSLTAKGAHHIAGMPNLTSLIVTSNHLKDEGAQLISGMTNLTTLDIGSNILKAAGAQHIARMTNLTNLDIRANILLTATGSQHISNMINLTALNICYTNLKDAGAQHIAGMSNLTELDIGRNNLTATGAQHISRMTNLTTLNIFENWLTNTGAQCISGMTNLTTLNIGHNDITATGAQHISGMTNLTTLNLNYNDLRDRGAQHISKMPNLTNLDIIYNQLTATGAEHVARMLALTRLSSKYSNLTDRLKRYIVDYQPAQKWDSDHRY